MTLPLTSFRARLADIATEPIHVLGIGDSVTEGTGASSSTLGYFKRLIAALQAELNPDGVAGGSGYSNVFYNGGLPSPWSFSGGGGPSNSDGLLGFRGRSFAADETADFPMNGTGFSVHFIKGTAFTTAGKFTVTVDGGSPATVTPSADPQNERGVHTVTGLAAGAHTVHLAPFAGGAQLYTRGIHVMNGDEDAGVHGWEAGHYGIAATTYPASSVQDFCALYDPALVLIFLGLNDLASGTAAATYRAAIEALIAAVDGYCAGTPSFLLVAPYDYSGLTGGQQALVPQYAAALAAIDAADANVDAYDLSAAFNAFDAALMADTVHPNPAGHQEIADLLSVQITGTTGGGDPDSTGWTTLTAERWNGDEWEAVIAEQWNGDAWVPSVMERAT